VSRDPRIDAYIAKAALFAQPILGHVRDRVHAVLPDVEETLKWSMPSYTVGGKIVLITAAFKAHLALNFWRGQELRGEAANADAMGQFGKIRSMGDLPKDAERADPRGGGARQKRPGTALDQARAKACPRNASGIRGGPRKRSQSKSGAGIIPAKRPARLFRMDRRSEAGRHPRKAHRDGHRVAKRGQAPALEIRKLLRLSAL
jgi:hypothetical protein